MAMNSDERPRYRYVYTVILCLISGLALMMVFSHQMLLDLMLEDDESTATVIVFRFLQSIEAVYFVFALAWHAIHQLALAAPRATSHATQPPTRAALAGRSS